MKNIKKPPQTDSHNVEKKDSKWLLFLGSAAILLILFRCLYGSIQYFSLFTHGIFSYAYVTDASENWAIGTKSDKIGDSCQLSLLLPKNPITQKPRLDETKSLLREALVFSRFEGDDKRICDSYKYTWQKIVYDPKQPGNFRFLFGLKQSLSEWAFLGFILIAFVIKYAATCCLRRSRQSRGLNL